MRGLDTNVIVRFVMRDEPSQARKARETIMNAARAGERLHVDAIVLCEVTWVLKSAYGQGRARITEVLTALLETPELVIEDSDLARRALKDFSSGTMGFADAFIAHRNRRAGCDSTLTFEKRFRHSGLFEVLG